MLGTEIDGQLAEPLLEVSPTAPADNVDIGRRERSEVPENRADLGRGEREIRVGFDLAQRAVVVEHDRPRPGARESSHELLLESLVDEGRWAAATVAPRVPRESREKTVGPASNVERFDALGHGLETTAPLARLELERGAELIYHALHVPGIHEQRAG